MKKLDKKKIVAIVIILFIIIIILASFYFIKKRPYTLLEKQLKSQYTYTPPDSDLSEYVLSHGFKVLSSSSSEDEAISYVPPAEQAYISAEVIYSNDYCYVLKVTEKAFITFDESTYYAVSFKKDVYDYDTDTFSTNDEKTIKKILDVLFYYRLKANQHSEKIIYIDSKVSHNNYIVHYYYMVGYSSDIGFMPEKESYEEYEQKIELKSNENGKIVVYKGNIGSTSLSKLIRTYEIKLNNN